MSARPSLDAIVVGSGPNGLAAAIALAREGHSVRVYEAQSTFGGGARSAELTRPGFVHDLASTVHALALLSPFLKSLPLAQFGLEFAHPDAPFAHPLDDGTAVVVERSIDATVSALGLRDGCAYARLVRPLVEQSDALMEALLGPFSVRHPIAMTRFGRHAIRSAEGLAKQLFESERTRAMFAGVAAHSMVVGVACTPIANAIFSRLLWIVETVRAGDPFVTENAARLQTIAWSVLALELARFLIVGIANSVSTAARPIHIDLNLSVTPWLAVLLLFVLARVFDHGARMREDLAGTV